MILVTEEINLIMRRMWILNFLTFSAVYTAIKCEGRNYNTYKHFYQELGCTKKQETGALVFNCPEFPSKNGSCRFSNHFVSPGEKIDQELLRGSCIPECKCNNKGFFTCTGTDCALVSQEGCHMKHNLDSCCPDGLVCGDDIAKCEVEGKTYKEGEKIFLEESCSVCVCNEGFKKEPPFCRTIKCYHEILRQDELAGHAAPVFLKGENCCPSTWIIDEGEDDITTFISDVEDYACKFGKRDIALGDGFYRNISRFGVEAQLKCECYSPPYVICQEI